MKKVAWLLSLIMIFSAFTSCSSKPVTSNDSENLITSSDTVSETQGEQQHIFSLPYFKNDSLNPYSAKQSVNFYLGSLIYDSLFELDRNFKAVPVIADMVTQEGTTCVVTIKKGLKFSDGSEITLQDVASSIKTAKSSSYYSARLNNISSYKIKDNAIVFALKKADINFVKNLNFPIVKGGSAQSRAIGSGRYAFSPDENILSLCINEYNTKKESTIKNISLVEIHKYSTLPYMVKIGSVNFVYATSDDFDLKTAAAKTTSVLMNNLVYLGINSENVLLANQDFRKAISLLVNRKAILTDAYANAGSATATPFHPLATDLNTKDYSVDLTNAQAAAELFSIAGLTNKNEDGILTAPDLSPISLRLVVNKENPARVRAAQSIKLSLEGAGVAVELIEANTAAYKEYISNGDYDMFIGEVKLTPDNDISPLLSKGMLNSCDDGGETLLSYNKYLAGEISLADFLRAFDLKTPFIPIMYRNGTAVSSGTLSGNTVVTEYDVYSDMYKWVF